MRPENCKHKGIPSSCLSCCLHLDLHCCVSWRIRCGVSNVHARNVVLKSFALAKMQWRFYDWRKLQNYHALFFCVCVCSSAFLCFLYEGRWKLQKPRQPSGLEPRLQVLLPACLLSAALLNIRNIYTLSQGHRDCDE